MVLVDDVNKRQTLMMVTDDDCTEDEVRTALLNLPPRLKPLRNTLKVVARSVWETRFDRQKVDEHPPSLISLGMVGRPGYENFVRDFINQQSRRGALLNLPPLGFGERRCVSCGHSAGKGRPGRMCKKCRGQQS